ncbi:MAG: formate/nitrite transporter family protein [Candidatus Saganbacteria bacterium]|nr:formate/nitrite transporter family protein [Candidatus Saganbacteria bacterium]
MLNQEDLTPFEIANYYCKKLCIEKAMMSDLKLVFLGVLAGLYVGFGSAIAILVLSDAQIFIGFGLSRIFAGAAFSVGIMLVVIAGAELFTGNNLMFMGVCNRKISFIKLIHKWLIVYFSNFIGAIFIAFLLFHSGLWKVNEYAFGLSALKIANAKVSLTFIEALSRGILCNILVCLAIWMSYASKNIIGKIFAVFFPISTFVALNFEHSVANMTYVPFGLLLKGTEVAIVSKQSLNNLSWGSFFINNLLPVTLGNIIGGALIVGVFYWVVYCEK